MESRVNDGVFWEEKKVQSKRWVVGAAWLHKFIFCINAAGHSGAFWENKKNKTDRSDTAATTGSDWIKSMNQESLGSFSGVK